MCAALASALLVPPVAAAGVPRQSCAFAGSRTVLFNSVARIYYTRAWRPYSCYRITGRRVPLDMYVDRFYAPGDPRLGNLRMAGRVLAYTWTDPGEPAVYVHSVDMRLARFHRRAKVEPPSSAEPSAVEVSDLVVRRSGAIAWIQRLEGELSVWRLDARGRRRLDAHPEIAPASLRRAGTRLLWTRAGATRRSTLR